MELYIIRHGHTDWNKEGRLQGSRDIPLNEDGRKAALDFGKKCSCENISFDAIYSSPLIRAFETAQLIRGEKQIPIIKDQRLREISFGVEEGAFYKDWDSSDSPYKYFFAESDNSRYIPPEGGETLEHICQRTADFIKTVIEPIQKKNPAARILITAHGALNAALMCCLENRHYSNFWGKGLLKNCEAAVFEFNGQWTRK